MNWPEVGVGAAIGVAITLAGGYLFFALQLRRDTPVLAFRSFSWPILDRPAERDPAGGRDIEIRYRDQPIPRITRSRLAVWNAGWKVIDEQSIVENDPLCFGFRRGDIVDATLVRVSREASNVSLEVKEGKCFVEFSFLDRNDGAIIDALHTASDAAPIWNGAVKGMPDGIQDFGPLTPPLRPEKGRARRRVKAIGRDILSIILNIAILTGSIWVLVLLLNWSVAAAIAFIMVALLILVGLDARRLYDRRRRRIPSRLASSD